MTEAADRVWTLMDDISLCMLVTHDGRGDRLRARPMDARPDRDAGVIHFLSDARHYKDDEIAANPNVCVAFADTGGQKYVSITGQARVSNDRAKIAELFDPTDKAWWQSAEDSNIRLLTVTPSDAEFWDGPGTVISTVKMAAAAVFGTRPDLGDNEKVSMQR